MSKYIGYKGVSNEECSFEVVDKGSKTGYFVVRFENGYEGEYLLNNITERRIKNPYHPSVYGVGYVGVGNFLCQVGGKRSKEYNTWSNMIMRCYDPSYHNKRPTYLTCEVEKEWHCFQNFAYWYTNHRNYSKGYDLDKDLKIFGNKVYSPETCDLIPPVVNNLLSKYHSQKDTRILGVSWCDSREKFRARCQIYDNCKSKEKLLGHFDTEQEAFFAYKKAKEENVKRVAEYYKDEICIEIFNNLMNWQVPIPEFE